MVNNRISNTFQRLPFRKKLSILEVILGIIILFSIGYFGIYHLIINADIENSGEMQVSSFINNASDYSNSTSDSPQIPLFDKFELTFDIDWHHNKNFTDPNSKYNRINDGSVNPYWPYDSNPSANTRENIASRTDNLNPIEPGVGISVDGIFTAPDGQTITQPGFFFQDYEISQKTDALNPQGKNWLYPKENPKFKIRFSPTQKGTWQFRIRLEDSTGVNTYLPAIDTFNCVTSDNPGFVKVSETDTRYFETSKENKYLNLVGLETLEMLDETTDEAFNTLEEKGINLIKPKWSGSSPDLFGWSKQNDNDWQAKAASITEIPVDHLITAEMNNDTYMDVAVKPNTNYKVSALIKTVGLAGNGSYGAGIKAYFPGLSEDPLTELLSGDTDWTNLSSNFTTLENQYFARIQNITFNTNSGNA